MKKYIENIENTFVGYLRNIGEYGENNIVLMEELKNIIKGNGLWDESTIIYGIALDNPNEVDPLNCRYDVCVVLKDKNMKQLKYRYIEGGLYLILRIEHTSQAVQNLYMRLHELVSESRYEYDNTRVIMERYIVNVVEQHECDICIPIKY